ncbi:MAG: hypothetical protein AAB421_05110 [Patescibacteria group bacterium]
MELKFVLLASAWALAITMVSYGVSGGGDIGAVSAVLAGPLGSVCATHILVNFNQLQLVRHDRFRSRLAS